MDEFRDEFRPAAPKQETVMDRIIAAALQKAQEEALAEVFKRWGQNGMPAMEKILCEHVIAYLKGPEGRAKVIELAEKAIARLMAIPNSRY